MEVGAADPPNKQPSTQRHLGKRLLKISFKRLLSRWLSLGHLLVMGVTRDLGLCLEGRQRRCRAIIEQSARFGKLVTYALPCVSSAHSPNRCPLSPALFLSPLNCFPGLGCSPPTVGLPGGRIRHPPSAVVALAALAGAGPGGLAFAEQRIPVLRMVQPRLLALAGVGGTRASAVEDKPIHSVMRRLCTLSARWSILTIFSGF